MFSRTIYTSIFLLCLLTVGTGWYFQSSPSRAQHRYQRLMDYSEVAKRNQAKVFKAEQRRTEVSKQILFSQNGERLQWRLHSGSSELSLAELEDGLELIERFKGIKGVMQEKSHTENRLVRVLETEDAIYHYKDKQLLADQTLISQFQIPLTDEWVDSFAGLDPVMTGSAEKVEISFKKANPSFKAMKFQASINLEKGL